MISVMASVRVHEDRASEFEARFTELAQAVREKEPGNLLYQLFRLGNGAGQYQVLEVYRSKFDLATHHGSHHFRSARARMANLLVESPSVQVLEACH